MGLSISEIFSSIQGEGPFMGRPALFVRLSGCVPPLCPWCDTPYAQGPGQDTAIEDILDRAKQQGHPLAVITGGEPFLQWDAGLDRLEAGLLALNMSVQYETSGKLPIANASRGYKVCSPKYLDGQWQVADGNISKADCFKFVVDTNMAQIDQFVAAHAIPAHRVWLMPLGDSREIQLTRAPEIWQACTARGYNFSPRLHTLVFNNKKGI